MTPFPWGDAIRFGFGVLRLGPREFWGLTPRELASAVEGASRRSRPNPPPRSAIDLLMAAFPDEEHKLG